MSDLKSNVTQLTHNAFDEVNPTWSPDSTAIMFEPNREDDKQWLMDLKGEHHTPFVTRFQSTQGASWLNSAANAEIPAVLLGSVIGALIEAAPAICVKAHLAYTGTVWG